MFLQAPPTAAHTRDRLNRCLCDWPPRMFASAERPSGRPSVRLFVYRLFRYWQRRSFGSVFLLGDKSKHFQSALFVFVCFVVLKGFSGERGMANTDVMFSALGGFSSVGPVRTRRAVGRNDSMWERLCFCRRILVSVYVCAASRLRRRFVPAC